MSITRSSLDCNRQKMRDKLCHVRLALIWCSLAQLIAHIPKSEAALSPDEENVLTVLQQTVLIPSWAGNPCDEKWINCSNTDPQHVQELHLSGKNLTGAIPSDISNLSNISFIDFNSNQLNGSIPDIRNLTNLTHLWMAQNNFSGGIPESLFQEGALVEIDLHINKLNGTIPKAVENMTQAKYLNLRSNLLVGNLPNLSALVNLEQFDASNNGLTGPFPDITTNKELFLLSISSNFLRGPVPASVYLSSKLQWLFMSNNSFDPAPMFDMSHLTGLWILSAGLCNFQGAIPSLENNHGLQELTIPKNNLTTIPSDLRNLSSLTILNVASNRISGNLPLLPDASTQTTFLGFKLVLKKINFSNNSFTGEIPESWSGLSFLEEMNLAYNSLEGALPKEIGRLSLLKTLNLSNNHFSGSIPDEFKLLTKLQTLDLRNNQLTGAIPEELGDLTNLQSLFLDNNSFSCIPLALAKMERLNITFGMKVSYCGSGQGRLSRAGIIGVAVGSFCVLGAILAIILLLIGSKRKRCSNQLSREAMPKSAKAFSLREIKIMTENFKQSIGKGGFGVVYFGKLPSGKEVAVKVRAADSNQGAKEFQNEVQLLCRLHHRNLVPILGYCLDEQQQILVYEYMPQGTLHDHLHQPSSDSTSSRARASSAENMLDWKTRLNIVLNAARGLEYLHKNCKPPVIHRDVKSSNILLTEKLEGKVSDLGISRQVYESDTDETHNMTGISTAVQGTWGYLDPEYFTRHKLTAKSDVYSFGVILLEVVTGKRAQCQKFPNSEAESLKQWVEEALKENTLKHVIDPRLKDEYTEEGMIMVVKLALSCLLPDGARRPDMSDIIHTLLQVLQPEEKLRSKSPEIPDEVTVPSSGQLSDPTTLEAISSPTSSNSNVQSNQGWKMSPR